MNANEIKFIESQILDGERRNLAAILLRLNKMIDKLINTNKAQECLKLLPKYDNNKYEKKINEALETLKEHIKKVKDNNLFETGFCSYQDPQMK